jgi:hypothetical protein
MTVIRSGTDANPESPVDTGRRLPDRKFWRRKTKSGFEYMQRVDDEDYVNELRKHFNGDTSGHNFPLDIDLA